VPCLFNISLDCPFLICPLGFFNVCYYGRWWSVTMLYFLTLTISMSITDGNQCISSLVHCWATFLPTQRSAGKLVLACDILWKYVYSLAPLLVSRGLACMHKHQPYKHKGCDNTHIYTTKTVTTHTYKHKGCDNTHIYILQKPRVSSGGSIG
jgi:hypothetical protein